MEPESPSPYPQVHATCPYPEPTPSSTHDPLQLPEDPSSLDAVTQRNVETFIWKRFYFYQSLQNLRECEFFNSMLQLCLAPNLNT